MLLKCSFLIQPENPPKVSSKDERSSKRKCTEPRRVRAPKTPLRTICIRTDDPMELARDHNLHDAQGRVLLQYFLVVCDNISLL
jgi:hypothetical protein